MKVKLTTNQFDEVSRIVKGIAKKKGDWFAEQGGAEELEQELWVKALNIIEGCGEYPGGNLIASSCYNLVTDLYRKKKVRQRCFSCEEDVIAVMGSKSIDSDQSMVIVEEMRNIFPVGTKERELFELFELWSGINNPSRKELRVTFLSDTMRTELALNMGYANSSSNGYRRLVWKVQDAINDYLDGLRNAGLEDYRKQLQYC